MKEIIGGKLELAFRELGITALKTYEGNTNLDDKTQVWELDDTSFEKLCQINDSDWKDEWGWWRSADGSNVRNPLSRFNINKHYIKAWDGGERLDELKEVNGNTSHPDYCYQDRKYKDLLEYFCDEIGASQPRNVCALAVDLARINNIKLSELFSKYQG